VKSFQNVSLAGGEWIVQTNANVVTMAQTRVIRLEDVCASPGTQGILVRWTLTNVNRAPTFVVIGSNV